MRFTRKGWTLSGFCFLLLFAASVSSPVAGAKDSADPHTQPPCLRCHQPGGKKVDYLLIADVEQDTLCTSCHEGMSRIHYRGLNPFVDSAADEVSGEKNNQDRLQPLCIDCHAFHSGADTTFKLSKIFLQRAEAARNINPHWNNYLCICCHERKPDKKNVLLRENGNPDRICSRCHSSKHALKNIHPVGMVPSRQIQIPSDMPLQENRLSCFTCHAPKLQVGTTLHDEEKKRSNPFFLRRKNLSRNGFCFICHLQEAYQRMNPHIQLDEQGNIKEGTCLLCHPSRPDVSVMGPEHVDFIIENPDQYCTGCHHGFNRGHPAGVDHLRRPSEKIQRAINASVHRIGVELPLYLGKIVCATCHNPHQQGVLEIRAAAAGSQRTSKLRLMPGNMQCLGCHWGKH